MIPKIKKNRNLHCKISHNPSTFNITPPHSIALQISTHPLQTKNSHLSKSPTIITSINNNTYVPIYFLLPRSPKKERRICRATHVGPPPSRSRLRSTGNRTAQIERAPSRSVFVHFGLCLKLKVSVLLKFASGPPPR
jgi:hypothetical protein